MKLRQRLVLIGLGAFALVVGVVLAGSNAILLRSYRHLERLDVVRNLERVRDALSQDVNELDRQLADWAGWDQTYEFARTGNPGYVRSNIPDNTFGDLRLNVIVVADPTGRIVFSRAYDRERRIRVPVPLGLLPHLQAGGPLLSHSTLESMHAGILILPHGPMIIASRPILTSERAGPIGGSMVWGRWLDAGEVARLAEVTHLTLRFLPLDTWTSDRPIPGGIGFSEPKVIPLNAAVAQGSFVVRDLWGAPALVLRVDVARTVFEQGRRSIAYFVLWFGTLAAGAAVLTVSLLDRLVLSRHAREQAELRHRTLVQDAAPVAVITLDQGGVVRTWNAAAERIFGWHADEVLGCRLPMVPDTERAASDALIHRVLEGETLFEHEAVRVKKDGTPIHVSISAAPLRNEHRIEGVMAVVADISDRKRAEAGMERQLMRLGALRAIDMAIAGSLDLSTILTIILDQVITHLGVDAADILLFDRGTHTLDYAAARGFRTEALRHTRLQIGDGHAGRAALDRRIVRVDNLFDRPGDLQRAPALRQEGFRTYVAAPLVAKGEVQGILEIFQRAHLDPSPEWQAFLEALAGQAAIALDNAALFSGLQRANDDLILAYDTTLEGWSRALDLRDRETEGHTQRVTDLTVRLSRAMGLAGQDLLHIRRGALLHDIGKMGIPDAILLKPSTLTDDERVIIERHPVYAYDLLSAIPYLRQALDIPYAHHEKWDGSGYPRGLTGEAIPLAARLFAVVDVWDALTSDRPYRAAWSKQRALAHIHGQSGTHFDPSIVDAFLALVEAEPPRGSPAVRGDTLPPIPHRAPTRPR